MASPQMTERQSEGSLIVSTFLERFATAIDGDDQEASQAGVSAATTTAIREIRALLETFGYPHKYHYRFIPRLFLVAERYLVADEKTGRGVLCVSEARRVLPLLQDFMPAEMKSYISFLETTPREYAEAAFEGGHE